MVGYRYRTSHPQEELHVYPEASSPRCSGQYLTNGPEMRERFSYNYSVADPDPESKVQCFFDTWIWDGKKSASGFNIPVNISESLVKKFCVKIHIRDPLPF
jgi:hypothetical protein